MGNILLINKAEENKKAENELRTEGLYNAAVSRSYYSLYQHVEYALKERAPGFNPHEEAKKRNHSYKKKKQNKRVGTHDVCIEEYIKLFKGHLSIKERAHLSRLKVFKEYRNYADYSIIKNYDVTVYNNEIMQYYYDLYQTVSDISSKLDKGVI